MYTILLKGDKQLRDIKSFENWELDSRFLLLKDENDYIDIINKDDLEKITNY